VCIPEGLRLGLSGPPGYELGEYPFDIGSQSRECCTIRLWPNPNDDVSSYVSWK